MHVVLKQGFLNSGSGPKMGGRSVSWVPELVCSALGHAR